MFALSIRFSPIDVTAVGDSKMLSVRLRAVTSIFSKASCLAVVFSCSAKAEVDNAATMATVNCER